MRFLERSRWRRNSTSSRPQRRQPGWALIAGRAAGGRGRVSHGWRRRQPRPPSRRTPGRTRWRHRHPRPHHPWRGHRSLDTRCTESRHHRGWGQARRPHPRGGHSRRARRRHRGPRQRHPPAARHGRRRRHHRRRRVGGPWQRHSSRSPAHLERDHERVYLPVRVPVREVPILVALRHTSAPHSCQKGLHSKPVQQALPPPPRVFEH